MPHTSTTGVRLADLAAHVGARLDGDGDVRVVRVATLDNAGPGTIGFLANPHYRAQLATTRAAAVIVAPADAAATTLPKLITDRPYAAFARVATLLHPPTPVHRAFIRRRRSIRRRTWTRPLRSALAP